MKRPAKGDWIVIVVVVAATAFIYLSIVGPMWQIGGSERENIDRARCRSNMSELALAMIQYTQDYDNVFPPTADSWAGAIYPYLKSTAVYQCPDDPAYLKNASGICSYAMNSNLIGHKLSDLASPNSTVLFAEINGTPPIDIAHYGRGSLCTDGVTRNTAWGGIRLGTGDSTRNPTRHDPDVNFAACGGRVRLLTPDKVSSGLDNPSAAGGQDGIHAAGTMALGTNYLLTFSEK